MIHRREKQPACSHKPCFKIKLCKNVKKHAYTKSKEMIFYFPTSLLREEQNVFSEVNLST
jgi:hypothetical protein